MIGPQQHTHQYIRCCRASRLLQISHLGAATRRVQQPPGVKCGSDDVGRNTSLGVVASALELGVIHEIFSCLDDTLPLVHSIMLTHNCEECTMCILLTLVGSNG